MSLPFDSQEAMAIRISVLQMVCNALIRSHPDKETLRQCWASVNSDVDFGNVTFQIWSGSKHPAQRETLRIVIEQWTDLIARQATEGE
ncbi:MAG TPA: hypothetical protein VFB32_15230 [Rudaea sp.]|nr:hypothetical protein [Rudaea sp.]